MAGPIGSGAFARKLERFRWHNSPARKEQKRLNVLRAMAVRSKTYSHSRRVLTQRASAARRKLAGLGMSEPTCNCGVCSICLSRKRAAKGRQTRKELFYWEWSIAPVDPFIEAMAGAIRLVYAKGDQAVSGYLG